MNFAEQKKGERFIYWTNELGDFKIDSPKQLDVDTVDTIFGVIFNKGKTIKGQTVKLGGEYEGHSVLVDYTPPNPWEDIPKETTSKKVGLRGFLIKILESIINLIKGK